MLLVHVSFAYNKKSLNLDYYTAIGYYYVKDSEN